MSAISTIIIAPHADDEILGCGGYLAQNANKCHTIIVAERTYPANRQAREGQTRNALSILNNDSVSFLNFKDEQLYLHIDAISKEVEKIIYSIKPAIVLTPFYGDNNQDHRAVYDACSISLRRFAVPFVRTIMCYEVPSSTDQSLPGSRSAFTPTVFIPLTLDQINTKIKAFNCYKSERRAYPHPRSGASIKHLSKMRGLHCNNKYAESYSLQYTVSSQVYKGV